MSRFVGFLISNSNQRSLRLLLWLASFATLMALSGWFVAEEVSRNMRTQTAQTLASYERLRSNALSTFEVMSQRLVDAPCSAPFLDEMRKIAFLPDGINELLYAPNGTVMCSVNSGVFETPVSIGQADVDAANPFGVSFWLDRDLGFLRLENMTGTIAGSGNFAMVVPSQALPATTPRWMEQELVFKSPDSRWWHRSGTPGIYVDALDNSGSPVVQLLGGSLLHLSCDPVGVHCIASRTRLGDLFALGWGTIGVVVLVTSILSAWIVQQAMGFIARHWSFEARFLRHFEGGSVVCAYQPLLNLRTDTVTGCEVLARWYDHDGSLVSPDRFLSIVEKHGLTERFTALVVDRAFADLNGKLTPGTRLQINFNIFPQDLRADFLIPMFADFLAPDSPFDVAIEIVETGEVRLETAETEIERLRAAGIRTYIDDFGSGYSSMQNLARLSIDGVKLDRSFAMALDDSIMSRMLDHAIDMVQASGRNIVVEGVETAPRLQRLVECGKVDFAQGYYIARPLTPDKFLGFLHERGPRPKKAKPRLVA